MDTEICTNAKASGIFHLAVWELFKEMCSKRQARRRHGEGDECQGKAVAVVLAPDRRITVDSGFPLLSLDAEEDAVRND